MGYDPTKTSEVIEGDFGPTFEVEYDVMSAGTGRSITVWFHNSDWGDDRTTGKTLTPNQAREFARVLEEYAQHAEPESHA